MTNPAELEFRKWIANPQNDPIEYNMRTAAANHVGDTGLLLAYFLSGHSMKLPTKKAFSVYLIGASGKGKTHCAEAVFDLFPEEWKFSMSSDSDKYLFYLYREVQHPLIIFWSEMTIDPKDEKKMGVMRQLLDNAKSNHGTLEKDEKGKWKPVKMALPQNCPNWFNSVSPLHDKDGQMLNRVFLGNPNESEEQDKQVFQFQYEKEFMLKSIGKNKETMFCQRINQMILEDDSTDVLIPLPIDCVEFKDIANRRNFPKLCYLIKAIAHVRANHREETGIASNGAETKVLLPKPEDIELGFWLYNQLAETTQNQVSKGALQLLELLPTKQFDAVNKQGASDLSGKAPDRVYRLLKELYLAGLVDGEQRDKRAWHYWRSPARYSASSSVCRVRWDLMTKEKVMGLLKASSVIRCEKLETYAEQFDFASGKPKPSIPNWINELIFANIAQENKPGSERQSNTEIPNTTEQQSLVIEAEYVE